jgi:hypothetical protein
MFILDISFPNATDEQKWEQIRLWRNAQLSLSDWTQLSDSSADSAAWATYRKELRDLPAQNCKPEDAVFPVKP